MKNNNPTASEIRQLESLVEHTINDPNILLYIFGTDNLDEIIEESLTEYRLYPFYMKNVLSLAFYFSYACYRYDMDYGSLESEKLSRNNAKRVIKNLKDSFVRFSVTQDLIQHVLTDVQFDLSQDDGELKGILGTLSNRDMSRFGFKPYYELIAEFDKGGLDRYICEDRAESLRMLTNLLDTLTFLRDFKLKQIDTDLFQFVSKIPIDGKCLTMPLNHIFYRKKNSFGGIYHLFSVETHERSDDSNASMLTTATLRYFSDSKSFVLHIPDEGNECGDTSHLAGQRLNEVYMEITGWEMSLKSQIEQITKESNSIAQIHTVNYKYIKNLALAISDAISSNSGSKEALYTSFGKSYSYIFSKKGIQPQHYFNPEDKSLDWDTIVIMLLIEASPTSVLERLMFTVPQTFYDIVKNLYNRTGLEFFASKQTVLDEEVKNIFDNRLVVGEALAFGKIDKPKPAGRLLARARAMLIISRISLLQEKDQDENLIYTGNLRSNISLLQNIRNNIENEKRIRYSCTILSETLKHLMCFYSGLYAYGEKKAEYDSDAYNRCMSKKEIDDAQSELENVFFAEAAAKADLLTKKQYESDRPKDAVKLFQDFIDFCDVSSGQRLYTAVGKYEITDKNVLKRMHSRLNSVIDDPYSNSDVWVGTTLEILEYFKTGSFKDTPYDYDLLNTIYPFTAAFNRRKENPDGYETVNFSLNIDIDNDATVDYQTDINVLSEFSYERNEVYYCLPNVIRSNYKWWIDPVLINFRKFNDIFVETAKDNHINVRKEDFSCM